MCEACWCDRDVEVECTFSDFHRYGLYIRRRSRCRLVLVGLVADPEAIGPGQEDSQEGCAYTHVVLVVVDYHPECVDRPTTFDHE